MITRRTDRPTGITPVVFVLVSALFFLSILPLASAQALTVETDQASYQTGDTITISGNVGTPLGNQPALIRVTDPNGVLVRADQANLAADGSYTYSFPAGGLMTNDGEHTVQVTYGSRTEETTFDFSAIEEPADMWRTFTLNIAGENYPIRYQITGGSVGNMTASPEIQTLTVTINSRSDGVLTIEIPRVVMDAEEAEFSAFIDGISENIIIDELEPTDQARILSIEFERGTEEIDIVGTYMVPEFGAIAAIVLAVAIVGIIVATARYGKFNSFVPRL